MRPLRLAARSRVGVKGGGGVDSEAIKCPCIRRSDAREISISFGRERMKGAAGVLVSRCFQHNIKAFRVRSPDAEMRVAVADEFCSDRITA